MPNEPTPHLLIFRESTPEVYHGMSAEQRQQLLQKWTDWYDGLAAAGKLHGGLPLAPVGRVVSAARGGAVVDGPFAESKEAIGGYFLLSVGSLEEATQIARQCPMLPYGMIVEVRPGVDSCHLGKVVDPERTKAFVQA